MQVLKKILFVTLVFVAALPFLMKIAFTKDDGKSKFSRAFSGDKLVATRKIPIEFHAVAIQVYKGRVFVYNFDGGQILEMDSSGKVKTIFGERGVAPGQFELVSNFALKNNSLFCFDARNTSFLEFDITDGKLKNYHKIKKKFSKALILNPSKYIVSARNNLTNTSTYEIYDRDGEYLTDLDEPYGGDGFSNDGIFVSSGSYHYHICYHVSNFIRFDSDGNTQFKGTTIENHFELPPVIDNGDAKYLSTKAKTLSYTACADSLFLYILSAQRANNEEPIDFDSNSPVDVYNSKTGQYLETFYIPTYKGKKVRAIAKYKNGFYTIQGNYILFYEKNA